MEQEIIIGIAIAVTLVVIFGIHSWLHKILTFKMDESAILGFLKDSVHKGEFIGTKTISTATEIPENRVVLVCRKSSSILGDSKENQHWRFKHK